MLSGYLIYVKNVNTENNMVFARDVPGCTLIFPAHLLRVETPGRGKHLFLSKR